MKYDLDQFKLDLITQDLPYVASKWILEKHPSIFLSNTEHWIKWKEQFSKLIKIDSKAIIITGSACVGFSLSPSKNYRVFNDISDVDVAIISRYYYDISWHTLRNLGTKRYTLSPEHKKSVDDHVNRLIYWGTIGTEKILDIMPFGKDWIESFAELSDNEYINGKKIKVRIYMDFESLKAYCINNLNTLKKEYIGGLPNEIILEYDTSEYSVV